jgi:hypothetical protein
MWKMVMGQMLSCFSQLDFQINRVHQKRAEKKFGCVLAHADTNGDTESNDYELLGEQMDFVQHEYINLRFVGTGYHGSFGVVHIWLEY